MTPLPTSGLHLNINESLYHADPASLSSSSAKTLIYEGPDALKEQREAPSLYLDAFDFGSTVHALILGEGEYEVLEYDSYRSRESREARDALRTKGVAPILPRDMVRAEAMRASVFAHPDAAKLLSSGRPEVSMWATDPMTGVLMKGRSDWLTMSVVDLKTTSGMVTRASWVQTVWSFKYAFQFAYYNKILELNGLEPHWPLWIAVSKQEPYEAGVFRPSAELMRRSERDVDRALWLYAHCKETDTWPALREAWEVPGVGAPRLGSQIPFLESVEEGLT